ncbi:MAG: tetratricopeptide repeat protein, partial [Rhodothermales bacterium]|nr:tetratricopeptide repeat protein [Rhodothermales bacterium]
MHSFLPSLLISLIVVLTATTVHHAAGQEVTSSVLMAQAERALDEEQFEDAVRLATRILASEPDHSRARLARAHAWLFTDPANPDDAAADIAHVLDREPDNPRAHELDLWHDYRYGSSFLLPFRTSDRLRRARQIIESDSTRRLAHLVAGLIRYSDFRDTHEAVRFRSFTRPGDATGVDDAVTDAAAYLFDTEIDTAGDDHGLSFRDPSVTGIRMDYTPLTEAANRYAREAADRLLAASGPDRPGVTAHRYLAEVFVRLKEYDRGAEAASDLIRSRPDLVEGWMYRGMFRAHSGDWEGADEDFEAAFERSAPSVRLAMTSPELFTPDAGTEDGSSVPGAYWMENDPLWSTGTNEALIEHVARMVEADLRFGNPSGSVDGWSTDPGTVFV